MADAGRVRPRPVIHCLLPPSLVQSCRLVHMIAVVVLIDSSLLVVEAGAPCPIVSGEILPHRLEKMSGVSES